MDNNQTEKASGEDKTTMFDLPAEIRAIIYNHLFDEEIIETTHQVSDDGNVSERLVLPHSASILFTCRLLHHETVELFWNQANLSLVRCPPFNELALCRKASPYQWNAIRSLYLGLGTAGDEGSPFHQPLINFLAASPPHCKTFLVERVRPGDSWNVARLLPFDPLIRFFAVWKGLKALEPTCGEKRQQCSLVIVPTAFHLLAGQIRHWLRGWRETSGLVDEVTMEKAEGTTKEVIKAMDGATEAAITFTILRWVPGEAIVEDDW